MFHHVYRLRLYPRMIALLSLVYPKQYNFEYEAVHRFYPSYPIFHRLQDGRTHHRNRLLTIQSGWRI